MRNISNYVELVSMGQDCHKAIQALYNQKIKLQMDRAILKEYFGEGHGGVIRMTDELCDIEDELNELFGDLLLINDYLKELGFQIDATWHSLPDTVANHFNLQTMRRNKPKFRIAKI